MNRSDTKSNINQIQINEFIKIKTKQLRFNKNGIAILYKEYLQNIAPIFFGIKLDNEYYDTYIQKNIIFKSPFVLFKPNDSIYIYKDKWFIFYYYLIPRLKYNDDIAKDYTEEEFNNMSI